MQAALQQCLQARSPRCAQRGEVIPYAGPEIPYKVILHAVAVDGWYHSSPTVISAVTGQALHLAAKCGARKVALTALATGFGGLSFEEFAQGLQPWWSATCPPIEEVVICLLQDFERDELQRHFPPTLPHA